MSLTLECGLLPIKSVLSLERTSSKAGSDRAGLSLYCSPQFFLPLQCGLKTTPSSSNLVLGTRSEKEDLELICPSKLKICCKLISWDRLEATDDSIRIHCRWWINPFSLSFSFFFLISEMSLLYPTFAFLIYTFKYFTFKSRWKEEHSQRQTENKHRPLQLGTWAIKIHLQMKNYLLENGHLGNLGIL